MKSATPSTPMHNRFALDDELLHAVLARGLHDRRIAVRPIVSAAHDQACFRIQ
jgi:hypothetical protein